MWSFQHFGSAKNGLVWKFKKEINISIGGKILEIDLGRSATPLEGPSPIKFLPSVFLNLFWRELGSYLLRRKLRTQKMRQWDQHGLPEGWNMSSFPSFLPFFRIVELLLKIWRKKKMFWRLFFKHCKRTILAFLFSENYLIMSVTFYTKYNEWHLLCYLIFWDKFSGKGKKKKLKYEKF